VDAAKLLATEPVSATALSADFGGNRRGEEHHWD